MVNSFWLSRPPWQYPLFLVARAPSQQPLLRDISLTRCDKLRKCLHYCINTETQSVYVTKTVWLHLSLVTAHDEFIDVSRVAVRLTAWQFPLDAHIYMKTDIFTVTPIMPTFDTTKKIVILTIWLAQEKRTHRGLLKIHEKNECFYMLNAEQEKRTHIGLLKSHEKKWTFRLLFYECVHWCQRSFLLESIYLHCSWCKCRVAAIKRLPVLHYSVVYIFWYFCDHWAYPGILEKFMRITDEASLAETS